MPSTYCYVSNISHNKVNASPFIFQRKCNKLPVCLREIVTSVPWMSYILSGTLAGFLRISDCFWQDSHCECTMSLPCCFMTRAKRSPHGAAVRLLDMPRAGTCDATCNVWGKNTRNCIQYFLTLVLFTFCTCCILRCIVCIVVSCLVCIAVSCLACIVVVVLCVLL